MTDGSASLHPRCPRLGARGGSGQAEEHHNPLRLRQLVYFMTPGLPTLAEERARGRGAAAGRPPSADSSSKGLELPAAAAGLRRGPRCMSRHGTGVAIAHGAPAARGRLDQRRLRSCASPASVPGGLVPRRWQPPDVHDRCFHMGHGQGVGAGRQAHSALSLGAPCPPGSARQRRTHACGRAARARAAAGLRRARVAGGRAARRCTAAGRRSDRPVLRRMHLNFQQDARQEIRPLVLPLCLPLIHFI